MSLRSLTGGLTWFAISCLRSPLIVSGGSQASTIYAAAGDLLTPIVPLERVAHDAAAFTQGLFIQDGVFYESTGLRGRSTLRRVEVCSGNILQSIDLPAAEFGEGSALVGDTLYVLTWTSGIVHLYHRDTFEHLRQMTYEGEGWGLCYDGHHLAMSNGGTDIVFRNPQTFAIERTITVTLNGTPIRELNELECVGESIFANVWQEDVIFIVDASSGNVTRVLRDEGLLTALEAQSADVLNGIAWNPENGDFWFGGKLWPAFFRVQWDGMEERFGQGTSAASCGTAAPVLPASDPPPESNSMTFVGVGLLVAVAVAACLFFGRTCSAGKKEEGFEYNSESEMGRIN